MGGQTCGWQEKFVHLYLSNQVRSWYLVETLVGVCRCATSWCDLDMTFDFAVVTSSLKIFSGLYFRNRKI